MAATLLEIRNIKRNFGQIQALKGVSTSIRKGSVHGLLGENGAGKSTLVRIVAGVDQPDGGKVLLDGVEMQRPDVRQMESNGVFLVTQEPMIVTSMTIAENLMLGRWPASRGFVRYREMNRQAAEFLADMRLDPRASASTLNAVERRKLNILRALHSGGKLIILDEPTSDLTMNDKRQLFDFVNELKAKGVAFLFISHYNEEILEICDEVSVLRDGSMISSGQQVSDMDSDKLSELVVGHDVTLFRRTTPSEPGRVAWQLRDIQAAGLSVPTLDLREGEIIGFAGLSGSGAKELGRVLFGLVPGATGQISHNGARLRVPATPAEAIKRGIAFLAEDRLRDGFIGIQSISENIALSSLPKISDFGWINSEREQALTDRYSKIFQIKAPSSGTAVGTLSGGNQQKVCLSRLMATEPQLIILNEPTRGIDVGVKEEVHRSVDRMAAQGVSVIIITSDLDEMLRVVDRVALFAGGRLIGMEDASQLTKDQVFDTAFSADTQTQLIDA